jgi:triosephosphate isomerase (TIM)
MTRKKIVAANWKMNLTLRQGEELVSSLIEGLPKDLTCDVVIAPPLTHIHFLVNQVSGTPIHPAAQNCHPAASGAYTGEVSVEMLKSAGAIFCITGHSERRQIFNESNDFIKSKVNSILKGEMIPIFCCGEPLDVREKGEQNTFVLKQLEESIFHLEESSFLKLVIAYEPIWAIGTGVTASPEQAQEMHAFIREAIQSKYGPVISHAIQILYGGSIKADNALSLFTKPDVDGGLVGGASLDAKGFLAIIEAAC